MTMRSPPTSRMVVGPPTTIAAQSCRGSSGLVIAGSFRLSERLAGLGHPLPQLLAVELADTGQRYGRHDRDLPRVLVRPQMLAGVLAEFLRRRRSSRSQRHERHYL